jgi:hypothetical protein
VKSYASSVKKLLVSDQFGVALLSDGRIQIHEIQAKEGQRDDTMLPNHRDSVIHSACISKDFLVFGTDSGHLFYYETAEWLPVAEYKHSVRPFIKVRLEHSQYDSVEFGRFI